jgi:hypothetical protein
MAASTLLLQQMAERAAWDASVAGLSHPETGADKRLKKTPLRFLYRTLIVMLTRFALAWIALALLPACQYHARKFAGENPPAGTVVQWPRASYDEVRAYCYDYTAEKSRSFLNAGRMHSGVMDAGGVKLTPEQVQRLVAAVTVSQPKSARTPCYAPHHAFVFFSAGKPVAVFEMCFGCNQFQGHPGEGLPEYIDTQALWTLCKELELPLGKGNEFYTHVVREYRKSAGR